MGKCLLTSQWNKVIKVKVSVTVNMKFGIAKKLFFGRSKNNSFVIIAETLTCIAKTANDVLMQ